MVHFRKEPPAEFHKRMAVLCDRAAGAYASEMSTERDPQLRERLARKAREQKEAAAFHRETAERLSKGD